MRHLRSPKKLSFFASLLCAGLGGLCGAPEVLAQEAASFSSATSKESSASPASWSTTTHVGFAVVDRSTTGMERVTGSLVLLDVSRRILPGLDVGFRSAAQGGKVPGREYYRLAAGPMISWQISSRWVAQAALGLFEETGLDQSGDPSYESKGQSLTLGWERIFPLGKRAELAWGGFVMRHQGDVAAAPTPENTAPAQIQATSNVGLTHGALVALRVRL